MGSDRGHDWDVLPDVCRRCGVTRQEAVEGLLGCDAVALARWRRGEKRRARIARRDEKVRQEGRRALAAEVLARLGSGRG